MSRALVAAKSGHGKSWFVQQRVESELPNYPVVVVLDYKDEYRGLVKSDMAQWAGVGSREASMSAEQWRAFLDQNQRVVVARAVDDDAWREVCGRVARAVRSMEQDALVVMDESHFVAPQRQSYPEAVQGLATTGRGEGVSSMWVTQRLSKLDETVVAQADIRILGGFTSENDLNKISGTLPYPVEVHNMTLAPSEVPRTPGGIVDPPVSVFNDSSGSMVGSEWVWSDDSGAVEWVDTRDLSMESTHYSPEGNTLSVPG